MSKLTWQIQLCKITLITEQQFHINILVGKATLFSGLEQQKAHEAGEALTSGLKESGW